MGYQNHTFSKAIHRATANLCAFAACFAFASAAYASQDVELQIVKGEAALLKGEFEAAEKALRKATKLDNQNEEAWMLLGQALSLQSKYADAVSALSYVDPVSWPISFDLGLAQFRTQDYPGAISSFSVAKEQGIEEDHTQFYLAVSQYKLGEYSESVKLFRRVNHAGLDPEMAAYALLYQGLAELNTGETDQSKATLRRLGGEFPNSQASAVAAELSGGNFVTDATVLDESAAPVSEVEHERDKFMRFKLVLGTQFDSNPCAQVLTDDQARGTFDEANRLNCKFQLVRNELRNLGITNATDLANASPGTTRQALDAADTGSVRYTFESGLWFNFFDRKKFSMTGVFEHFHNVHFPVESKFAANNMRWAASLDNEIYLENLVISFGADRHAVRQSFLDLDSFNVYKDNGQLLDALFSLTGEKYLLGWRAYGGAIYQISEDDRVGGTVDVRIDDYYFAGASTTEVNIVRGIQGSVPLSYRRVLVHDAGLSGTFTLIPKWFTSESDDLRSRGVGLSYLLSYNPIKQIELMAGIGYDNTRFQNDARRRNNLVNGNVGFAVYRNRLFANFTAAWDKNFSTDDNNDTSGEYFRSIYGASLGLRFF